MATKLDDFRAKYPGAYDHVPDAELADRLYAKFYEGKLERREFDARMGINPYDNVLEATGKALTNVPGRFTMGLEGTRQMAAEGVVDFISPQPQQPDPNAPPDIGPGAVLGGLLQGAVTGLLTDKGERAIGEAAAKQSLIAQLNRQQAEENLTPIDVAPGSPEYYVSGAVGSVAEMAPGLALSILARNPTPAMANIAVLSGGNAYAEGREQGLPTDAAREYAALYAAAEAIPEALPLGILLKEGTPFITRMVKSTAAEAVQETLTEALQIGIDMGYLSPDMTWGEAQERLKDAAVMGAIAGPLMGAVAHPAQKVTDVAYDAAERGKQAVQQLFGVVPKVGEPAPAGPTMLDRVNQKLTEWGFRPTNKPEPIAPAATVAPAEPATSAPPAPPAEPAGPATAPAGQTPAPAAATGAQPSTAQTSPANGGSVTDRIAMIESGGDPTAQNPNSSAGGLGQFIDSTWLATVRKHAPELANESDAAILARKKDASPEGIALQRRMLDAFTADNVAGLQAAGIEATPGNTYLAHFLGLGGAQKALSADPNASVRSVMGADVVDANPFLENMTIAGMRQWAESKMAGAGSLTIRPGAAGGAGAGTAVAATAAEPVSVEAQATAAPTLETAPDTAPPEMVVTAPSQFIIRNHITAKTDDETMSVEVMRAKDGTIDALMTDQGVVSFPVGDKRRTMSPEQAIMETLGDPSYSVVEAAPQRTGGVPADAQAETDLIETSRQQREAVEGGRGVLAPAPRMGSNIAQNGTATTAQSPTTITSATDMEAVRQDVNPAPTPAQIEAGNYKKAHVRLHGFDIAIETPKGAARKGVDPNGQGWEVTMPADYGYIKRTTGADGDHIDVYVGPQPEGERVFIVDQIDAETGAFDEHKVIMGVQSADEAKLLYKSAFSDGKGLARLGNMAGVDLDTFKQWVADGDHSKPFGKVPRAKRKGATFVDVPVTETASVRFDDNYQARQFELGKNLMELNGIGVDDAIAGAFPDPKLGQFEAEARALHKRMAPYLSSDQPGDLRTVGHFARHAIQTSASVMDEGSVREGEFRTISTIDPERAEEWARSVREEEAPKAPAKPPRKKKGEQAPPPAAPEAEATPIENGTAPEHVTRGVDDRELAQIVEEFNNAQADMMQGDHPVSNVFQPPAKRDIVRLQDKAKVYHKEHGWMTPAEARAKIEEWKEHAAAQGDDPAIRSANSNKVVLSLFDLSGAWSQPWEDAGYQVYRFDIQDNAETGDVNNFSTEFFGDWFGDFDGMDIYAILAACPCTDFASSGARHFATKDEDGRTIASVKLVHQTLRTIEYFKPAVWAVENPVGRIEKLGGLPPWRLSFDPNHLGEPYTKKTLIWGRFNGELPVAPVEPTEGSKMWSQYGGKSLATKNARSVTPEGFSYAFFMANNAHDHQAMAIANKYDRLDRGAIEAAVAAGATESDISEAVDDFYYFELDDDAANEAVRALAGSTPPAPEPEPPTRPVVDAGEGFAVGKELTVTTPGGTKIQVQPVIIDGAKLLKATGELQPRDRSRAASDAQIEDIAINLDPDRLLPSREADRGAPIIGPDNVVESGNGRRMALVKASQSYPAKYLEYVKAVKAAGYDFPAMEGTPILVLRRLTPMTDAERVEFVNDANTSAIARMSATEQAIADARLIDDGVLGSIEPGRGAASLGVPGNKLAKAFLAKLPQAERASLTDAGGQLNTDGVRRIQNALLAAAYGDAATVAKAAEAVDDNAKSITGALIDVSADWIAMRRDIEGAGVDPAYDMTDPLMGALKLLDGARTKAAQQGRPVKALINEALGQVDMLTGTVDPVTEQFVEAFYSEGFGRAKSRDKIAAFLRAITAEVSSAIQPQLLGAAPSPQEVIGGARRKTDREEEQQGDIFASRAPGRGAGQRRDRDGNGSVQRAGAQDQQRAGTGAERSGEQAGVGELSGRAAEDAGQRTGAVSEDGTRPADDRGEGVTPEQIHALGGDTPMANYVPLYATTGLPQRPASGKFTLNGRTIDIPDIDAPQRREGVRTRLEHIIGPRLYYGKIKGKSRLGFYRRSNSEVRIKSYDDIEVMAHEMAHYLDFHYEHKARFASKALPKNLKDEVKQLSYTSDPKVVVSEGFAEFVRLWLTNYDAAKSAAPKFTAHFEAQLAADPALQKKMERLQEDAHKWFLQGAHAQLRAKSGEEYSAGEQVIRFMQSYPAERFRQEAIDKIHAANVVERTLKGTIQDATRSAYKQFQMVNGAESVHESIVKDGTVAIASDGTLVQSGIGLAKVFFPVAKHGWKRFDLLMDYFKARRASELKAQGRENLFTRQEIEEGLALGAKYPEFEKVFQAYQDFNERMLDFYEQAGLITVAMRESFREANKSYVPFHRIGKIIEEGNREAGGGAIGKRLKGGSQNVRDIGENIVEGLFANVRAAMIARAKQQLYRDILRHQDGSLFAVKIGTDTKLVKAHISDMAKTVAGAMVQLGIGVSRNGFIISQGNVQGAIYDVADIADVLEQNPHLLEFWQMNQPPKTDGDTYVDSVILNGEKVYFEVREPLLVDMLTGMRGLSAGAVLRALYSVKNFQTRTVTSMLQFLGPNAWRDTVSAAVLSKNGFVPVVDTLIGMGHAVLQTPLYREFRRQGGGYGTRIEARTEETRSRRTLDLPARNAWDVAAKFLAGYDRFASAFEYGSRVGDYRRGRKAGKNAMEAAWEAREVATDFSKIGRNELWAKFIRTVPFMNAGIQGVDKTARELAQIDGKMTVANLAKFNRTKAVFMLKGSVMTAMTLVLWLLNADDERYQALTDDERARFWWVFVPGLEKPIKIPRPYDIGYLFASIPETMLNYVRDKDGEAAAKQLGWIALNSMPVGDYPGILQPWVEVATNKTFTGAPVVPHHMADMPPRYQFNDRTPAMYVKLGELFNVSPMVAEHISQGYLRYVEQYLSDATEAAFWNTEKWGERPFVKGGPVDYLTYQFVGRRVPYRTKWTEGYFNLKSRAAGMRSALSNMMGLAIKDGTQLSQLTADRMAMTLQALDATFGQIDSAFEDQDAFLASVKYNPNLTAAEKEAKIDAYYEQKNAALATAYRQISAALDQVEQGLNDE